MDVYEAIYTTRAMRRVKPDPIPEDVLKTVMDAAVRGPSGGNAQTFRMICVTDPEIKSKMQKFYRACLDELNATQYASVQDQIKEDEKNSERSTPARINDSAQWLADNLHNVPMLIFFFGKLGGESTTFPVLWNLCLSARAEGLGTCITTLLKLKKDEVEEVLETPDDGFWHMHAMIPIGYPMGNWGIAQRKPANLSTFQDRWDNPVSWEIPEPLWPNS